VLFYTAAVCDDLTDKNHRNKSHFRDVMKWELETETTIKDGLRKQMECKKLMDKQQEAAIRRSLLLLLHQNQQVKGKILEENKGGLWIQPSSFIVISVRSFIFFNPGYNFYAWHPGFKPGKCCDFDNTKARSRWYQSFWANNLSTILFVDSADREIAMDQPDMIMENLSTTSVKLFQAFIC